MIAFYLSTWELVATVTDDNGDVVTGATVTCTITDADGTVMGSIEDADMTEEGSTGVYVKSVGPSVLSLDTQYYAAVKAISGSEQRYAKGKVRCVLDRR